MKKYNFGRKGWTIIIICFLLYLLTAASTTDGENIILPKLAAENGWDYAKVLSLASVAGCCSVVGNLLLGKLCEKKGAKFSITMGLIATAIFVFLYGSATNMTIYVIGLFGAICCGQSFSFFGASSLIANWFPRKKGLAMGIVTMGPPVATISMVSIMNTLLGSLGLRKGVMVMSIVLIIVAVICILLVHETPEECGATPDNMPKEELVQFLSEEEQSGTLPLGKLIKMKEFWSIMFMMGVCNMSQTGLMAQFMARYQGSEVITEGMVVAMMSVLAIVAIFGSMVIGMVENKLGTQKAYSFFAIWFAIAFAVNFTNVKGLIFLSVPMFGVVLCLMQIFLSAFEISVFGRTNFKQANAVLFPIISMIGQLTFVIISMCLKIFGEIRYAYLVYAVLLVITVGVNKFLKMQTEA